MTARHPAPVRPSQRRWLPTFRRWHRWLGLAGLVVLLLATLSGTALVFKQPLVRWLVTGGAELPATYAPERMPPELARLARHPALAPETLIKAPNPAEPFWTLSHPQHGIELLALESLSPYTDHRWLLATLAWMRELHTALLAGVVGEALLLASGVAGMFLALSGLLLWWPGRRGFRWRLVVPGRTVLRAPLLGHRHSGALAAPLLMLLLATGSLMLWQKLVRPLLPPLVQSTLAQSTLAQSTVTTTETRQAADPAGEFEPDTALAAALTAVPDGWPTYIRLPAQPGSEFSVRFRLPGEWHPNGRTTYSLTGSSATLTERSDRAGPARWLVNQLYPLHAGYGMGNSYATLVFGGGVLLTWLTVTGGLSWWRRRSGAFGRQRRAPLAPSALAASDSRPTAVRQPASPG